MTRDPSYYLLGPKGPRYLSAVDLQGAEHEVRAGAALFGAGPWEVREHRTDGPDRVVLVVPVEAPERVGINLTENTARDLLRCVRAGKLAISIETQVELVTEVAETLRLLDQHRAAGTVEPE